MKKLLSIVLLLFAVQYAQAQALPITDTGTLRTRVNADIKANNTSAITGDKLNRILNGQLNVTQGLLAKKVDSTALADSLEAFVRLQTQNPTATLNNDSSYERRASGTGTVILNYTAGRQAASPIAAATATISTIVVNSVGRLFTQPAAGASASGMATASIAYNTNTTFSNVVTTTDGKTVTAIRSINFYDKRYIGWATTPTPTDAEIRGAIAQDNSGGTIAYSTTLAQLGTSKYLFYANTVNINSVSVNGFPSSDAFNLNVSRSFTNAVGGTTTYFLTTSKNAIGATSATSLTIN
jgi:hypothetical protein